MRAATIGPFGSRSRGEASSGIAAGERDEPAALADDELRGRGVDRARLPQRGHPVDAGQGDLAERDGDRPHRPHAVDVLDEVVHPLGDPARVGGLDRHELELAVVVVARRRRIGQRLAVEQDARAALRDPLLVGPEVEDVAELHVAHRVPGGDGDRDRVVGQAALGVHRAVDRVDDDQHVLRAEVDQPALLAQRAEPRAAVVELLELGEDRVLGALVDDQRLVAALAAVAGLLHALLRGGRLVEDAAQLRRRATRGAEPVRRQCLRARGHSDIS